jgi:hypothetical protein
MQARRLDEPHLPVEARGSPRFGEDRREPNLPSTQDGDNVVLTWPPRTESLQRQQSIDLQSGTAGNAAGDGDAVGRSQTADTPRPASPTDSLSRRHDLPSRSRSLCDESLE